MSTKGILGREKKMFPTSLFKKTDAIVDRNHEHHRLEGEQATRTSAAKSDFV
jgi:hypothetical protein